jgi:transcription-repair coupling factor (superfamily II helicase)
MATRRRPDAFSASDCAYLAGLLRSGREGSVQHLHSAAAAHLLLALHRLGSGPVLAVVDAPPTLDVLHDDLATLAEGEVRLGYFPGWESLPGPDQQTPAELTGDRLAALRLFADHDPPAITLASIQALMQRTLPPEALRAHTRLLRRGDVADLEALTTALQQAGYTFEIQVGGRGEASQRGGILDVWPPAAPWPLRLEFFGPELESIRAFDPADQRSIEPLTEAMIPPAVEAPDRSPGAMAGTLFDYLPAGLTWVWLDPSSIEVHAQRFEQTVLEVAGEDKTVTYRRVLGLRAASQPAGVVLVGPDPHRPAPDHVLDIRPLEGVPALPGTGAGPDLLDHERGRFLAEIQALRDQGESVRLYVSNAGTRARFLEQYGRDPWRFESAQVLAGRLSEGFRVPGARLTVVAESDLYGARKAPRGRYDLHAKSAGAPRMRGERIEAWTDVLPGELIVHVDHGIGKYLGLYEVVFQGRRQEVLTIEYAQGARLQLPVSQAHLLTRYVGAGAGAPRLHRLGGKRWSTERLAAESSVRDLAAVMLETQAAREVQAGFMFSADQPWQHEFEAAFPFQETPDQHRAIAEVKHDMERPRPMDRLVCGDVGYGKTEVAMRAAFKAVLDGKQVAVLVPTTILAQQHFDTFTTRTAAFPFIIRMLSRFQTKGEQRRVVDDLASGQVDIVIGTHRLIQKDIRFRDLGLLIIDEEQRFGVEQKEFLKHMRQLVDVLTLTATPIPRTLYMSLMGTRDMSTIQSPPQERLPIQTYVGPASDEIIRRAILRELNRGGQVYFLHNRVATIRGMEERLLALVPEAGIAVGHGQMHEHELARVMREFVQGTHDVLLCTTIIESGMDIPNVNTMIIDRADRFGLSELYQLRGRVGRYKHQAYAYLLLPKGGRLMDTAKQRIRAIQKYGSLGAGFKLALKDLEIRGTGNLLGSEQSGHITAVGFELYCQFLKRTIARLKGEEPPPLIDVELKLDFLAYAPNAAKADDAAVIPTDYLPDEDLRVQTYRQLAIAASEHELDLLETEFADRFGPPPHALRRLYTVTRLRILASRRRLTRIETRDDRIIMTRDGDFLKDGTRFPRMPSADADGKLRDLLKTVRAVRP